MRLLEVNGISLLGATHAEAVNALRGSGIMAPLHLVVCHGYDRTYIDRLPSQVIILFSFRCFQCILGVFLDFCFNTFDLTHTKYLKDCFVIHKHIMFLNYHNKSNIISRGCSI